MDRAADALRALPAQLAAAIASRETRALAGVLVRALDAGVPNDAIVALALAALGDVPAETQLWWTAPTKANGDADAHDRRVLLELLALDVPDRLPRTP